MCDWGLKSVNANHYNHSVHNNVESISNQRFNLICLLGILLQANYNGSNTFGTIKICSREGQFELVSVNHSARTGGKIMISRHFSLK